jgi:hypothetical protein
MKLTGILFQTFPKHLTWPNTILVKDEKGNVIGHATLHKNQDGTVSVQADFGLKP